MKTASPAKNEASPVVGCDYCGLPVVGDVTSGEPAYCCFGCRFAASMTQAAPQGPLEFGPASALGFSIFFTMNVVMLTMALWSYADQDQSPFQIALGDFLRYGAMAFSLPVLLLLGRPLLSHALAGLRNRVFTTDLLLATGVLAAFAVSIVHTLRSAGHVYFEVGCVILVLVTMGRWLEATGRSQASQALDQLERLVPETVHRCLPNGMEMEVSLASIAMGDELHLRAGERIPVDCRVIRGRGVVDEQFFTGESLPVEKQIGDALLGGSLNLDGDLRVEVTARPAEGALGRLVAAVRAARLSKGRYQLLSDAWSRRFFPIISLVAIGSFFVHGFAVDWDHGLLTALSVVLIACPCALALATPLAVWVAMGTAAKRGVLFRSGAAMESMARIRAIRWDKTGTLTTGSPRVRRLLCEESSQQARIEQSAAEMVAASNHLFSKAIHEFLAQPTVNHDRPEIETIAGRGLRCRTADGGDVRLGSVSWMTDCGLLWGPNLSAAMQLASHAECPIVAIGYSGQVQGLFLLEETLRPESMRAIALCREFHLDQAILTGDRTPRAQQLGEWLSIPVAAELLPEAKLEAIRTAHAKFGFVAMVGDGLNDAPALAAADLGIALGCGADVSRDSADLCVLSSNLELIPWAYEFSRRAERTIRANLAWSFGYNAIGVIVAASGQLHPALAATLMVISSVMVLGNSLRLSSDGPESMTESLSGTSKEFSAEINEIPVPRTEVSP